MVTRQEMTNGKPRARRPAKAKGGVFVVSDAMLRDAMRDRRESAEPVDPFDCSRALHPPGGPNEGRIAQDEATPIRTVTQWAFGALQSNALAAEGQIFLGFPELSLLAQRPEYRRVSESIALEMTRKWIEFKSKGDNDKTEAISVINDELKRLRAQAAFRQAAEQDGFFGRSHIYIDTGRTDDPAELKTNLGDGSNGASTQKMSGPDAQKIVALRCVEPVWCYPSSYNTRDPLRDDWFKPTAWMVQGKEVHASRLLTFIGRDVPDLLKPAYSFGGLSLSQMVKPYIDNWLRTRQAVSDLIAMVSNAVVKTQLTNAINVDEKKVVDRIRYFVAMRSNKGVMVLDKDTEDFDTVNIPLGGLDKLQAQSQEHICSVSGLPLLKYTGISPSGLNASGEEELEAFYTWIGCYQEALFRDPLTTIVNMIQLNKFGKIDGDIVFDFVPLQELSPRERAEIRKIDAEAGQALVHSRAISSQEERARIANDPDTPYSAIDTNVMPMLAADIQAAVAANTFAAIASLAAEGLIDGPTALKAIRRSSYNTGLFGDVTDEEIAAAAAPPPMPEADAFGNPVDPNAPPQEIGLPENAPGAPPAQPATAAVQ